MGQDTTAKVERRLAAILAADVVGYSRLMGADEEGTLSQLKNHRRELIDAKIAEHKGRIVKTTGDGMLVQFASVIDAVRCAVEIQQGMAERNADVPMERRIEFRAGINVGDVIIDGDDIYGDGVNVAARLESLADPGGICISRKVHEEVRDKLHLSFEDAGERELKNIVRPIRVYRIQVGTVEHKAFSPSHGTAPRERLSIMVLPFANFSSDPEQEFFADGIVDDLTTDLSRISGSFVIARNTAFTYKGKSVDAIQVGRDLGVLYLLEGSVRRLGNQVRVNVQLIDARTGGHIWAERFDGTVTDLFALHEQVTAKLARTLHLNLVEAAARSAAQQTDPEAVDLVLRGRAAALRPRTRDNALKARAYFEQALKLAPDSAEAKIGLAEVLSGMALSLISESRSADLGQADQLITRALADSPGSAWAHFVKGEILRGRRRPDEAVREYQEAIALDHNYVPAVANLGFAKILIGEPQESVPLIEQAIRMSPHDPLLAIWHSRIGLAELFVGRFDQAVAAFERSRGLNPSLPWCHFYLASVYGLMGKLDDARASLAEAQLLSIELMSIANYKSISHMAQPAVQALREATLVRGLRLAGLPET
jgi:TolB-like protein/class 3 adenylate cyclase/Tfp pilus assembly protein PilF